MDEWNPGDVLQSIKQIAEKVMHGNDKDVDDDNDDFSAHSMFSATVRCYIGRVTRFFDQRPGEMAKSTMTQGATVLHQKNLYHLVFVLPGVSSSTQSS